MSDKKACNCAAVCSVPKLTHYCIIARLPNCENDTYRVEATSQDEAVEKAKRQFMAIHEVNDLKTALSEYGDFWILDMILQSDSPIEATFVDN